MSSAAVVIGALRLNSNTTAFCDFLTSYIDDKPLQMGPTHEGKKLLGKEQILSFMS